MPSLGSGRSNNPFQRTHSRVTPLADQRKRFAARRAAERERYTHYEKNSE